MTDSRHRIDESENIGSNPGTETSIGELIERRLRRRDALRGLAGLGAAAMLADQLAATPAQAAGPSTLTFTEPPRHLDAMHHVPDGYEAQVLIRWGDAVAAGAPAFDPAKLTLAGQEKQFGYNCDFVGLHPLPPGSASSDRFLMVVNHEYTNTNLMFSGMGAGRDANLKSNKEQCG